MAARPKSGITADTDVNLDFLTKEEKEALLSKKMDIIRQRNKALTERHKLIEADKKKAEEAGQAVKPAVDSQTLPAEGAPKPRGRGRGQNHHRDGNRPGKDRPKSQGDIRDSSHYEPIVDTTDLANYRGRGRGGPQDRDAPNNTPKNRRKPPSKEEAATYPANFEYEPIVDMKDLDKRFGPLLNAADVTDHGNHSSRHSNRRHDDNDQPASERVYSGRLKDSDGPPPDPSFNPLADRRRADKKDEPSDYRRHPRNYGGGADLTKVKQNMKTMREKEKERPIGNKPLELIMTGKERKNHEEWKAERDRYDKERIQRQMNDAGSWKRAWDADKINQETDDSYHSGRLEPAKRPAGRIGSGRFDRGDREERPRSAVIGKGGLLPQDHPPQQRQYPHQEQQPLSPVMGGDKAPKGRGRGRGRGRAKATTPGEKSPRPRTWSGGDDRFVECQKELLLVKFDNTAGDNSVEVEYDDVDLPTSPQSNPKSPSLNTTPGRGPTGRTPNQGAKQQPRGNKQKNRGPRHKGKQSTNAHGAGEESWETPSAQAVIDSSGDAMAGFSSEENRVRTSSHSQSYGDSEEWEDCTESSGVPEEDDAHGDPNADLHLSCRLNPEAPEFLPTSPDFLKTPPGHVKVLNWASEHSPTSPLSQGSQNTPPQLSQSSSPRAPPTTRSPASSSPGSSVSTKAMKMREEMDSMPEGDQPHPPPFLLPADTEAPAPPSSHSQLEEDLQAAEDEDEDEKFEDSVDDTHEDTNNEPVPQESSQSGKAAPSEELVNGSDSSDKEEQEKSAIPLPESAQAADSESGQRPAEAPASSSKAEDAASVSLAAELLQASQDSTDKPATNLAAELAQAGEPAENCKQLSKQPDSVESPSQSPDAEKKAEDGKKVVENVQKTDNPISAEVPKPDSVVQNVKGAEALDSREGDGEAQISPDSKQEDSEAQGSEGTEISGKLKGDVLETESQDSPAADSVESQDPPPAEDSALPTAADSAS